MRRGYIQLSTYIQEREERCNQAASPRSPFRIVEAGRYIRATAVMGREIRRGWCRVPKRPPDSARRLNGSLSRTQKDISLESWARRSRAEGACIESSEGRVKRRQCSTRASRGCALVRVRSVPGCRPETLRRCHRWPLLSRATVNVPPSFPALPAPGARHGTSQDCY